MNALNLSQTPPITPQTWMVVALAMITIVYAVFVRPMLKQKKDPLARLPGKPGALARQRDVERQMETLLVELSEMARQISAQLDTRAAKLEVLIKEADEKIAALRREPPTPTAVGRDLRPMVGDPGASHVEDARHVAVYQLADSGLNPGQIAQRLGRPSGEIELILALRSRK
jgi:type II secretory pathway component PulM